MLKKTLTPLYEGEKISKSKGLGVKYSKVKITRHSITCFHKCLEINCLNSGVKEKPQNVHFRLIFCHVLSRFNLRKRIHDPVFVTRIAF